MPRPDEALVGLHPLGTESCIEAKRVKVVVVSTYYTQINDIHYDLETVTRPEYCYRRFDFRDIFQMIVLIFLVLLKSQVTLRNTCIVGQANVVPRHCHSYERVNVEYIESL